MSVPRIVHLVDDATAGGVTRVLDHILTAPEMARAGNHSLLSIRRGRMSLDRIKADIIVSHLAISWRAMPMLIALRTRHPRTPLVHVEHSYTEAFVAANVIRKLRFATLLRIAYGLFNKVVAVSHAQGQWLAKSGAVRPTALSVIPSCVDLSAFRTLPAPQAPIRVIGAIGRIDRQKGFDTLVRAFRRTAHPDLILKIYGEGAEGEALRDLAGDDPRIRFMGFSSDPVAAMASVDLVAMPSNWEAYGLVAIEALAAGRILLVSGVDGLTDHIQHGARVITDNSVDAWRFALESVAREHAAVSQPPRMASRCLEQAFSNEWCRMVSSLAAGQMHCKTKLA